MPETREKLLPVVSGIDPSGKNIKVFPFGLSDRNGIVEFNFAPGLSAFTSYYVRVQLAQSDTCFTNYNTMTDCSLPVTGHFIECPFAEFHVT